MGTLFQMIGGVLALVGLFDLARRVRGFFQESVFISLRSPDKVLNWQCTQIAHASYVAAKKLHHLSRQLPPGHERDESVKTAKVYLDLRRRIYENLKQGGFQRDEFIALARKADTVLSTITGELKFNPPQQ